MGRFTDMGIEELEDKPIKKPMKKNMNNKIKSKIVQIALNSKDLMCLCEDGTILHFFDGGLSYMGKWKSAWRRKDNLVSKEDYKLDGK